MTLNFYRWKLDTCSCILHFYRDDTLPDSQPDVFFAAERVCPAHNVLVGLDKGEPDWIQPDHTVESENAARFALIDEKQAINDARNLAAAKNEQDTIKIRTALDEYNRNQIDRYAGMLQLDNVKAISKGIWNSTKEENDRKNKGLFEIISNGPNSLYDLVDGVSRTPKESAKFTFTWTGTPPNRVLTITTVISLTTNQRNTIQNRLNTIFGVGKVVLG